MKKNLSTKRGISLAQIALIAVFSVMVFSVSMAVKQSSKEKLISHERQVRDGYAAQSDLHRLTNLLLRIKTEGSLTETTRRELQKASDILWVRTDDITIFDSDAPEGDELLTFKTALFDVVEASDQYLKRQSPSASIDQIAPMIDAAEKARVSGIRFIDAMRRAHDRVINTQDRVLRMQNIVLLALAAILTAAGIIVLKLLRQEMALRNAYADAEKHALFLAANDPLTGLPNRQTFIAKILNTALIDLKQPSAIWIADVDHFKSVNDRLGHSFGDELLKQQSARMLEVVEPLGGIVARIAGDEFALWLPGDVDIQKGVASKILTNTRLPINFQNQGAQSSISLGIALIPQVEINEFDIERMLRHADFALYIAKSKGRDRCTIFDEDIRATYVERNTMMNQLRRDADANLIDVFLQPKIGLLDGKCFGFEALARWKFDGNQVSAEKFIELAENGGFASIIDNCVLQKAVACISEWNRTHGTQYSISVNLSAVHINDITLPTQISRLIENENFDPALLTLEVTETVEIRRWEKITIVLNELRALGCKIALDDFGTGYSSLAYLDRMEVDELKIDKSFVVSAEKSTKTKFLLSSVIKYAQDYLGISVVFEGIETEDQLLIARSLGARCAQGFYWGQPGNIQDILLEFTPERSFL